MPDRRRIYAVVPGGREGAGGMCRMVAYVAEAWEAGGRQPPMVVLDSAGRRRRLMPLTFLGTFLRLAGLGLAGRVALLHLHMAERGSVWRKGALVLLGRALGVPVVLHLHGAEFPAWYEALRPAGRRLVTRLLRAADVTIALGEATRRWLTVAAHVPARQVAVLHNAVPAVATHAAVPGVPCHVVFLGVLAPRKGVEELILALTSPRLDGLSWRATLAGGGPAEHYRARARLFDLDDRVALPGWLTPAASMALLHEADLLVLPSHAEGLPMAILEAMARGVPVLATPVGDVGEAVADGETGLLVPARDAAALAEGLARLIGAPALREALGAAGQARQREAFEIDGHVGRLAALYREVAASPRGVTLRRAALLGLGAAAGQGLALIASPLLSRLFDVAAFGTFGAFGAVTGAVGAVAPLKYDQAVVLEREAPGEALLLCLLLSVAAALVSGGAAAALVALGRAGVALAALAPIAVFVLGANLALAAWCTRTGRFALLARYQVGRTAAAIVLQLGGCLLARDALVLAAAQVGGLALAGLGLVRPALPALRAALRGPAARVFAVMRRHADLPRYATPQTLGHLLSINLPAILLPLLFGATEAGLFWLAWRVLVLPGQIVTESLRAAFFARAAGLHDDRPALARAAWRTSLATGLICLPVLPALWLWGPALFAWVFGAAWREAGVYAALVALPWWLDTVAMPSVVLTVVLRRQRAYLAIEVVALALRAAALLAGWRLGSPLAAIALFAGAAALSSLAVVALVARTLAIGRPGAAGHRVARLRPTG